jgi:olfactory receptor
LQIISNCDFPALTEEMHQNNSVTEFILLGLIEDPLKEKLVVFIFLIFYMGIVVGNMVTIVAIKSS